MSTIERFEALEVWQKARKLAKEVYQISTKGGQAKDFTLQDQLKRAAISILSNIAEGFERRGDKEFLHFLSMAKGPCREVRAQLLTYA
jgi:four helix bundle protein